MLKAALLLLGASTVWQLASPALASEIPSRNPLVALEDHQAAVEEGRRLGIGSVSLVRPAAEEPLVAAQNTTFEFSYETQTPIETGGYVWFALRHVFHLTPPQSSDPAGPGYVTVEGPEGVDLAVINWPDREDGADLFLRAFPWQHPIEIRVESGRLETGDAISVTFGDMEGGGPGVRMQPSQEPDFGFRVYVATEAGGIPLPLAEDVVIPVAGGAVDKLSLIAPSSADGGSDMRLTVRVEDRFGNQASGYSGTLVLRDESGTVVARTVVEPHDGGLAFFDIEAPGEPGVVRYTVDDGS